MAVSRLAALGWGAAGRQSSFLKKRTKKLLDVGLRVAGGAALRRPGEGRLFASFSSEEKESSVPARASPRERGFALLIVLWTMVLLALLSAQITGAGRSEAQVAAALRNAAQLEAAADGAVEETIWHMLDGGGQMWAPGAASYDLHEPGALVHMVVTDERGKLDVNQVPPQLLAGLFSVLGADNGTATAVANAIGDWRSQASPGDAVNSVPAEYRMEGRAWGPPGQEFERLDELQLVRGMTPALYQAALPYLTLDLEQAPWLQYASPVVLAALAKAKRTTGVAVEAADARGPVVLRLEATAIGPAGARFVRRVLMRLDGTLSGPAWKYRILSWD
jgi:general secretion pathway protein K